MPPNNRKSTARLEGHSSSGCDTPARYSGMHCSKLFRILYCNISMMLWSPSLGYIYATYASPQLTPLLSTVTNIFMEHLEKIAMQTANNTPSMWLQYDCGWHFLIMALWTGRAQSVSEAHQQHTTIHPVYHGGRRWRKDLLSWCTGCEGQWRSTVNQLTLTGTFITNRTIHITSRQALSELWWDDPNKSAIPQRLQIMNGTT